MCTVNHTIKYDLFETYRAQEKLHD